MIDYSRFDKIGDDSDSEGEQEAKPSVVSDLLILHCLQLIKLENG